MVGDLAILPVVYMGGACGDLVTAMIDATGTGLDRTLSKMTLPRDRIGLKRPQDFADDAAKDAYLQSITGIYTSVPSHDVEYHLRRAHTFLGVTVQDRSWALWAARRFRAVHSSEVWLSVSQSCGIHDVEQYAQLMIDHSTWLRQKTTNIVALEDILAGRAVTVLEHIIGRKLHKDSVNCYHDWRTLHEPISIA